MSQDNFAIQLAVGVKDIYSGQIQKIEAKTKDFQSQVKSLQQTIADVQAYRQSQAALAGLGKKQKELTERLAKISEQKKLLEAREKKLQKLQITGGKQGAKAKKQAAVLASKIARLKKEENGLTNQLKDVGAEQNKCLASGKKLAAGLAKTGINVKNTEAELKKLESRLEKVGKAEKKAAKISKMGGLAKGVAALGAGAFTTSLAKSAYGYETHLRRLAATTKLTLSQAQDMKPALVEIYTQTGKSIEEVAPALQLVVQQLGLSGKEATDATKAIMRFTSVHPEMDAGEIVKAAGQAKKAWGLSAEETLDIIATITEQAGDKAGDLLNTFWQYAPTMKEAGLGAKQFSAMLISGANAGAINFDKIAGSIKEAFKSRITDVNAWDLLVGKDDKKGTIDEITERFHLQEAGEQIKTEPGRLRHGILTGNDELKSEAWASLLVKTAELQKQDAQAAKNITEQIFGTQGSENMTAQVLAAMGTGLKNADGILSGSSGRANSQFAESLTFVDHLRQSWRELVSVFIEGAGAIGKDLAPIGKIVSGLAKGIASFTREHPAIAKLVVTVAGVAAAVSGLAAGIAGLSFLGSGLTAGLAPLGTLAGLLGKGLLFAGKAALVLSKGLLALVMNPVGATIVGIAAAAYLLWRNWDKVVSAVGAGIEWFKGFFQIGQKISGFLGSLNLAESGIKLMKTLADGILSGIAAPYKAVKSGLGKLRQLLPFSDAKEGPLSQLTLSGQKIMETMAVGVKKGSPTLAGTLRGGLGQLATVLAAGAKNAFKLPKFLLSGISQRLMSNLNQSPPNDLPEGLKRDVEKGSRNEKNITVNLSFSPSVKVEGTTGDKNGIVDSVVQALESRSSELIVALERAMQQVFEQYEQQRI